MERIDDKCSPRPDRISGFVRRILWTSGLTQFPFIERVDAAAALGYESISVGAVEMYQEYWAGGRNRIRQLREHAERRGIDVEALEQVVTWLPVDPHWRLAQPSMADVEILADLLGVRALCVVAARDTGLQMDEIAAKFAELCERAGRHGWLVALESVPSSGVIDLAAALRVLDMARHSNATLILDTRHFYRSQSAYGELRQLAGRSVRYVQVADADATCLGSLDVDNYHRRLPGDGAIDLVRIFRILQSIGIVASAGPEVIRPIAHGRSCLEVVGEMTAAVDAVIATAARLSSTWPSRVG